MGIEFHCSKCGKLIRAPGSAGGRRGKCPYCKESVYIPAPADQIEEIPLAPLDQTASARERRLEEEDRRLTAAISQDEGGKYDTGEPVAGSVGDGAAPLPRNFGVDVPALVNAYLLAMAESQIGRADAAARELRDNAPQAREHVQRLVVDELPPAELGNIPAGVYKGFLRELLKRLK